jgi:acyl carrier protein
MKRTRPEVLTEVMTLVQTVAQDWEFDSPITEQTRLYGDLAFESLDLVVLGAAVQERFGQSFPFPDLFAEIGQRDVHDLTIGELVDFLERHQTSGISAGAAATAGSRT